MTPSTPNPQFTAEIIVNYAGMFGLLGLIVLIIVVVFKMEKIRELTAELGKLKRAFNELDNQAKLIVQTDLELHRTQEELDKKVSGLVTLQELTRSISTTLDEDEIFRKIEEKHITTLGFDKAVAFTKDPSSDATAVRIALGYSTEEAGKVTRLLTSHPLIVDKVFDKHKIFSSMDTDKASKELPRLLALMSLSSFVCAPIMLKDGAIGALLLGSESSYTPLTEGDKDLVYILAAQIGEALENALLYEETWRSHQELEGKIQQRTKELSAALEEIKIISKRKSDFISAVSHELRTPLTSIKGYASILAAGKLGELPPAAKERIEKINKHSDSLSELINNLLDISRIESGRVEMKHEPLNIRLMAEAISDMLAPPMKERGLESVIDMPETLPLAAGDKVQVERVFINLVGNALKFTPAGGKITMRAKLGEDNMLHISISDTGIGIPEKDLEKIFEEFFRVDNDINQKVKGTGLGLTLVKFIVEAHKGKLSVSSQVNKGTTFTFTLPKNG
jgi:signal transduction histidine kinase/Sec-independent protein translocase protein TatA